MIRDPEPHMNPCSISDLLSLALSVIAITISYVAARLTQIVAIISGSSSGGSSM
jgi:hypothetical protein